MKKLLLICLLIVPLQSVTAQSRTEKAKDRMEGKSESVSLDVVISVIEFSIELLPEFFYFRSLQPQEPRLSYNSDPYLVNGKNGIRRFSSLEPGKSGLFDMSLNLSLPQGSLAMEQRSAAFRWNYSYWAFATNYEYMRETDAPFSINQFNIHAGRKFRFFRSGDADFVLGYRALYMGSSRYDGPEMGIHTRLFPFRPLSLGFSYAAMGHRNGVVENTELHISAHKSKVRFTAGHRWLNIAGVRFNTFTAGFGLYL